MRTGYQVIIVDTSAVVAIFRQEPDAASYA